MSPPEFIAPFPFIFANYEWTVVHTMEKLRPIALRDLMKEIWKMIADERNRVLAPS